MTPDSAHPTRDTPTGVVVEVPRFVAQGLLHAVADGEGEGELESGGPGPAVQPGEGRVSAAREGTGGWCLGKEVLP